MIRIGISGFGRIGRLAARVALRRGDMEVVAINAPDKTPEQIAYVFSHDGGKQVVAGIQHGFARAEILP